VHHANYKGHMAHRWVWSEQHPGDDISDKVVMHICDVRNCVNPAHLRLGTNQENTADKCRKQRQAKGERQALAKLTDSAVQAIRAEYRRGNGHLLAARYGVDPAVIYRVVKRVTWRHIA
jgi:3-deoxy-D-manno-octulosonate 8-phosphate phosphatase KdsC-like HAD superfamily phosphatase